MYDVVNCEWSDWIPGKCSQQCGGGTRNDTRTKRVQAKDGGNDCEGDDVSVGEICNVDACPGYKIFPINVPHYMCYTKYIECILVE